MFSEGNRDRLASLLETSRRRVAGTPKNHRFARRNASIDRHRCFGAGAQCSQVAFATKITERTGALWFFTKHADLDRPADYTHTMLCEYFGIKTRPNHRAFYDVIATRSLYQAMVLKRVRKAFKEAA